jgi:hypothetical protein
MQTIQAQAVPNQQLTCQLGSQSVTITIAQYAYGLFMSVAVAGEPVINSVLCQNRNRIVRSAYLGFDGDFSWYDTQGASDPVFNQIGTRFLLLYLSESDLAAAA